MEINSNKLNENLFKVYILLLPITLFHPLKLNKIFGAPADTSSFLLHVLGMIIIVLSTIRLRQIKASNLMVYLGIMIFVLDLSSLLMAFILNYKLGILYGENTYLAMSGDFIYYIQIFFIFYYNYYVGSSIDKKIISKMFYIITIYELIIGYLQILILKGFSFLSSIYGIIEKLGFIYDVNDMVRVGKIYLTGGEASSVANIVGFIVMPYILANLILNKELKYKLLLLLYIPIIYFSKSTTVYVAIALQLLIFIVILCYKKRKTFQLILGGLMVVMVLSLGVLIINKYEDSKFIKEIDYYLTDKITDKQNLSTVFRESTVKNNIKVFFKYPILGIGNGLQGYYYTENLDTYAYKSEEVRNVLKGMGGIPSGGSFLTAYISGYGLLGIIMLLGFIYKCNKTIKKGNELYYIYVFGGINFLMLSTMALGIAGNYLAIFIVSIPLFNTKESKVQN